MPESICQELPVNGRNEFAFVRSAQYISVEIPTLKTTARPRSRLSFAELLIGRLPSFPLRAELLVE